MTDGGIIHKVICVTMLFSFLSIGCRREEGKAIPTRDPLPQEVLEELTLKEMDKGRVVWILNAKKAINYEEEGVIKVYEIHLEFFDTTGVLSSTLRADSGAVFSDNDMRAMGSVEVVTRDESVLETDLLEWSNERKLISTDREIRISTRESVITGIGFESDPELKHTKVKRHFYARKVEQIDSLPPR